MPAWTPEKVSLFRESFYSFLKVVRINSKEKGPMLLGSEIYRAQVRFWEWVFDGLSRDIHDFKHLKSRQLGISTGSRALTVFWCGIHEGLRGYMVFDTDSHKEEARLELLEMINGLPSDYNFPRIRYNNRYLIELENGTRINLAAAGAKVTKTTNTLGRSSGINFVHCSEVCSWGDWEAVEAFKAALAQDFENRLYIWESTGKGYNIWRDIWLEAKEDYDHQCTLFTGWWGKDNQIIRRIDPDFEKYGVQPPTDDELRKIAIVKQDYNWDVTEEQLAWVRRYMKPSATAEGDAPVEFDGTTSRIQEVPWHEEEAFQATGSVFFSPEKLSDQINKNVSKKYKTWKYEPGLEFHELKVYPAPNSRMVELKVWEEPTTDAIYILSIDPAFGHSEKSDRSAIQVVRCYADGLDQVAEYAWPLITTNHLAWVAASLAAWYGGQNSDVYMIIEINGPGDAVLTEMRQLRHRLESGYLPKEAEEAGLRDIFRNVKNYFYWRSDALGPGRSLHWRTQGSNKIGLMERLRDFVSNGMLRVKSMATVDEMISVSRDGDKIESQGRKKDDRVIALALCVRMWEDRIRRMMVTQKRTRDNESAKRRLSPTDRVKMFADYQIDELLNRKAGNRRREVQQVRRQAWRYGR
jgi:hypothetical protein